jgi:hypothetical protein
LKPPLRGDLIKQVGEIRGVMTGTRFDARQFDPCPLPLYERCQDLLNRRAQIVVFSDTLSQWLKHSLQGVTLLQQQLHQLSQVLLEHGRSHFRPLFSPVFSLSPQSICQIKPLLPKKFSRSCATPRSQQVTGGEQYRSGNHAGGRSK